MRGDFFALAAGTTGFGGDTPDRLHAVLLDIDHTPVHVLHPGHAATYSAGGLRALRRHLPGSVFALWSDDPPDDAFLDLLRAEFASAGGHLVLFYNPLTGGTSSNVAVARG